MLRWMTILIGSKENNSLLIRIILIVAQAIMRKFSSYYLPPARVAIAKYPKYESHQYFLSDFTLDITEATFEHPVVISIC